MRHVLACADKFAGSLSARELAQAIADAARRANWTCTALPLSDGGEGLVDLFSGQRHTVVVQGALGKPIAAGWVMLETETPTAIIEMAQASGITVLGGSDHNRPVEASTFGTGELIADALRSGARRIAVGCGGSATTDGGLGAIEALGGTAALEGVELIALVDVRTEFLDAARVFGPQKGASASEVVELSARLSTLAARYRRDYGIDVTTIAGSGAAGGLAGGLAALGARIESGFSFVAEFFGLDRQLATADAFVTGEGRLDSTSFDGKVVGEVLKRARDTSGLIVAGVIDDPAEIDLGDSITAMSTAERFGLELSYGAPASCVEELVAEWLSRLKH